MILGTAHGSEAEKFQVARQEVGGMEEGLTADLKAWRAAISAGKVAEWTRIEDERESVKKKMMEKGDFDLGMVKKEWGKVEREKKQCRERKYLFVFGKLSCGVWLVYIVWLRELSKKKNIVWLRDVCGGFLP